MKLSTKLIVFLIMFVSVNVYAGEPTFMQYFYSVKQILPETKEIGVFITEDQFNEQKDKLNRAAQRTGVKAQIFLVSDMKSIGKNIKNIGGIDILLISQAEVLMSKSSRLFILSKCKDKKIPIISASEEYSRSGALVGLLEGDDGKSKIVLNVKHSPYLASRFTDEFNKKAGIKELIQ